MIFEERMMTALQVIANSLGSSRKDEENRFIYPPSNFERVVMALERIATALEAIADQGAS